MTLCLRVQTYRCLSQNYEKFHPNQGHGRYVGLSLVSIGRNSVAHFTRLVHCFYHNDRNGKIATARGQPKARQIRPVGSNRLYRPYLWLYTVLLKFDSTLLCPPVCPDIMSFQIMGFLCFGLVCTVLSVVWPRSLLLCSFHKKLKI